MNTDEYLLSPARDALALNEPIVNPQKELVRLRAQARALRVLAQRLSDRVGRPGPSRGGITSPA